MGKLNGGKTVALRTLEVVAGEQSYKIKIPEQLITGANEVFEKFDRDMARGWQMSRVWVASPDARQRCQIIADRLLTAIHHRRHPFIHIACAYIAREMPEVKRVIIDIDGDMTQTEFE